MHFCSIFHGITIRFLLWGGNVIHFLLPSRCDESASPAFSTSTLSWNSSNPLAYPQMPLRMSAVYRQETYIHSQLSSSSPSFLLVDFEPSLSRNGRFKPSAHHGTILCKTRFKKSNKALEFYSHLNSLKSIYNSKSSALHLSRSTPAPINQCRSVGP